MVGKLYHLFRDFLRALKRGNTSSFAAGAAFFMFLSIIPIIILICSILPYTRLTQDYVEHILSLVVPANIAALFDGFIVEFEQRSVAVISIAAISTLWVSGKGLFALVNGLNAVNGVDERRNWFLLRVRASFFTVLLIATMLFTLVILVLGNILNDLLVRYIPQVSILLQLLLHFRFLFVWAFFTLFFQILYAVLPSKKMVYRRQFPGALFASVGWSVFSWAFSVYLEWFDSFSIYGSLATIVIGMVWLYFCMYILLIGAQINIYFEKFFISLANSRRRRAAQRRTR